MLIFHIILRKFNSIIEASLEALNVLNSICFLICKFPLKFTTINLKFAFHSAVILLHEHAKERVTLFNQRVILTHPFSNHEKNTRERDVRRKREIRIIQLEVILAIHISHIYAISLHDFFQHETSVS